MLSKKRGVRVHELENQMTTKHEAALLLDLAIYAETERPRVVLNCSQIVRMDRSAIRLLLACLEVAMKCNGDVRLAALRPAAEAALRHAGMTRLFEIYATAEGAVMSFHRRPYSVAGMPAFVEAEDRTLEYAA